MPLSKETRLTYIKLIEQNVLFWGEKSKCMERRRFGNLFHLFVGCSSSDRFCRV